ncbi:MAG: ABC transporter ATP-binding protein [Defluviitaleaceae bacterium]|nr:ABC transporter ATP-binding protein [Defluviitaleaceae bacterium]
MISVKNLTKKYGKLLANDGVSVQINSGQMAVLLGPNGAGKSTLIKSICGLLRFEGSITINGLDNKSSGAKKVLGYVPEMPVVYPMLTVGEHLEFIARAYKLTDWEDYAEELLTRFELTDKRKKLGKELSKGMQQKVSICCALLPRPKAVILDEPLVGLDPHAIRELKRILVELKTQGVAVMVSTHLIDSTERDWDTTYIMQGGKIVMECSRTDMEGESLEDIYFSITGTNQGEDK